MPIKIDLPGNHFNVDYNVQNLSDSCHSVVLLFSSIYLTAWKYILFINAIIEPYFDKNIGQPSN